MKRFPKLRLPLAGALILSVLLAGFITLTALWCQPNRLRDVVTIFLHKPALIVLNALPVGLLLLFFACLLRNLFFGASVTTLLVCGFSVANRVKIQVRDEPVFPRDLSLLKEVGSAMGSYDIRFPVKLIAVVLGLTVLFALLGVVIGHRPAKRFQGWGWSLGGAAVSLAALIALTVTVLGSSSLYGSFGSSNPYRLSVVFNEMGFPYSFFHQFTTYLVDKPEGYSKQQAMAWDTEAVTPGEARDVSVIIVMNEAFSDITDEAVFAFPEGDDPLQNLHTLQSDPHAVAGRLVVPGFAGGTANTEFDVVTGMQTNALGATTTSAMRTVNRNLDSIFRVFRQDGYHTSFIHPGYDWFYNRENVYRWLGAEETVFIDQMTDVERKGTWVTDAYVGGLIEAAFETSAAAGQPLFNYTTTIQNHMAYKYAKYGEDYDYPTVPLAFPVAEEVQEMVDVYVEGVRDADALLGQLRDYFSRREEPVVLVYYGDHLPYLGDDHLGYSALNLDAALPETERRDSLSIYQTPFIIWANDAAAQVLDWDAAVAALDLPKSGKLSAAFLGAAVLELTGRGTDTAWFAFLNQLRREVPVVQKNLCNVIDGHYVYVNALPEALQERIQKWRQWSYYKLEQKELK